MVYKVMGLMSGSSLDGLDIVFTELQESSGKWSYRILQADCIKYSNELVASLRDAHLLNALEYQLLHTTYGHYLGVCINEFIKKNDLHHQVHLIVSHGHTTFHLPEKGMTAQLGDGAAIAAETMLPVVSDLRALDVALGGQGAPIVPVGESLLFTGHELFLNLGGIANISSKLNGGSQNGSMIAFDVCAANRVLNMLALEKQLSYDEDGKIAAIGKVSTELMQQLNGLSYYYLPYPKSLANDFGTEVVYPLIKSFSLSVEDAMRTYVEHIVFQVKNALVNFKISMAESNLFVTGGGALNSFLIEKLKESLVTVGITITIPETEVILYKEALIMALIGTLRWREEYTLLNSVTGASRKSIGGALWLGTEA